MSAQQIYNEYSTKFDDSFKRLLEGKKEALQGLTDDALNTQLSDAIKEYDAEIKEKGFERYVSSSKILEYGRGNKGQDMVFAYKSLFVLKNPNTTGHVIEYISKRQAITDALKEVFPIDNDTRLDNSKKNGVKLTIGRLISNYLKTYDNKQGGKKRKTKKSTKNKSRRTRSRK